MIPDTFETRIDGFYGGRFHLVQPVRTGYRSGLDALLLAATIDAEARGRLADVGAGAGAVGFAAGVRAPALSIAMIENQPEMAQCARAGLALAVNEAIAGRIAVVEADIRAPRAVREAAGLADGSFDWVVTNPPFYGPDHRPSDDPLRRAALNLASDDLLGDWFRSSLALLKDGGRLATILPPAVLPICLPVLTAQLGGLVLTPIHARARDPATRLIVTGRKRSRSPLSFLPQRYLFDESGARSSFSNEVANGETMFGWTEHAGRRKQGSPHGWKE
ncbi:methyltransferase [Fulvimarina sp. 2208YS6-2-32]|uniref:Methyltransferase n=1 Tax=Fulvimarina uroteuthidis TaxID=3098149 RepID=A0ABU5HXY7_9HYPH|nr:methyltransferase [Fulvimarina sp. 2208YS6-2-32]MDY8107915.1 methyltransferase [Fulvimarina sp. 2208YS6-2-32]